MHCCLCDKGVAVIMGGNGLCEEHFAEAKAEAKIRREDTQQREDKPDEKTHHDPFDARCVKHREGVHPPRTQAHCEICRVS